MVCILCVRGQNNLFNIYNKKKQNHCFIYLIKLRNQFCYCYFKAKCLSCPIIVWITGFKGAMPRCWYFAGHFLYFSTFWLPHLKLIRHIILMKSWKSSFSNNWRFHHIRKTLLCNKYLVEKYFTFFLGGS